MRKKSKGSKAMSGAAHKKQNFREPDVRDQGEVYPPRPSRDSVDLDVLRRDLMQRFSKTLAELAK